MISADDKGKFDQLHTLLRYERVPNYSRRDRVRWLQREGGHFAYLLLNSHTLASRAR